MCDKDLARHHDGQGLGQGREVVGGLGVRGEEGSGAILEEAGDMQGLGLHGGV